MHKTENRINKNKKIYSKEKKIPLPSINMYPHDSSYTTKQNPNNNTNEENVIANILKTNNIDNEEIQKEESTKDNNKIKYYKKTSSTSINVNDDYKEKGDFTFINISSKIKPFLYKPQKSQEYSSHAFNNFNFLDIVNSYRMIINILIDDDSLHSSNDLLNSLELIILSLNSLGEINISNKDFLVCIFFQHFSEEETFKEIFPGLNFYNCNNWNLKMDTFYCSYGEVLSVNDTPINVLNFYKENATFVEVYRFFYCNVLNDLISLVNIDQKEIGKTFLLVNYPNGKIYEKSANKYHKSRILSNIFRICNNRNMILIPDISYTPYDQNDCYGYLTKYNFDSDKVYVNLLWGMMCAYPIDHRFFFVNMNYKLYSVLRDYYQNEKISIYANEYYHDYNLSIYLKRQIKNITIQKIQQVKIEYSNLPSNLTSFFYDFILKRGSEYANSFALISYFFSCKNMTFSKFLQKIIIFFKLISFLIQFFWLGLSILISYAVFKETFGIDTNNIIYFCSLGYVIIILLLLFIATIFVKNRPKIKENKIYRNLNRNRDSYSILVILYILHYAFNILFIVCSIIAILHINKGRYKLVEDDDYYILNKRFFIILIFTNLLLVILPSFIRPSNLASKGFFYFLILQFINSTCFFHIPYLFTCIRNINSSRKNIESLYVTLYILFNGLLTIVCFVLDDKRSRRMDFFYIFLSILLILSGLKLIILIIGICWQNRFNKKISTGQIPQYNIINSVNSDFKYKIDDNNNDNNKDNLNINKNESNLTIKEINEKKNADEVSHPGIKNKIGYEKEYSSQAQIIPTNKGLLNQPFGKGENEEVKSQNLYNMVDKNYQILEYNENKNTNLNQFMDNIQKDIINDSSYLGKQISPERKKNDLNENVNNYNLEEGISYPFDSVNLNDENSNNRYTNEEDNKRPSQNLPHFALDQDDIGNNENNSISKIENVNNDMDDNL